MNGSRSTATHPSSPLPAMRQRLPRVVAVAAAVFVFLIALVGRSALFPAAAQAAGCGTATWADTTVSGDWSVAANWSPAVVPSSSSAVCLPQSATAYTVTLAGDKNGFVGVQSLQVGSGATLEIDSGPVKGGADTAAVLSVGTVTNAGAITLQGVGTTCQQATLIITSGNIFSNSGAFTLAGACTTGIVSVVQGTLNNSGAISVTGPSEFTAGTKTNTDPGTIDVTIAGSLRLEGGSFILSSGTLTSDGLLYSNGATFVFNGGTITGAKPPLLTNGSTLTMGGAGSGTVIVRDNTALTAGSSIGAKQAIAIDAGVVDGRPNAPATLSVAGDLTNAGTISLQWQGGSSDVCTTASLAIQSGKTLINTGTLTLNGGCVNSATAIIASVTGNLSNSGAVSSTGNSELSAGAYTNTDPGTFAVSGPGSLLLNGETFVLSSGTLTTDALMLVNGGSFSFNGGTITGSEPPLLTNSATLTMGGAGSGTVIVNQFNTLAAGSSIGPKQTVEIDAGVVDGRPDAAAALAIAGDLTNAGTITMQWRGGSSDVCTQATLQLNSGHGVLTNSGTLNLDGVCANNPTEIIATVVGGLTNSGTVNVAGITELLVSTVTLANSGRYNFAPSSSLLLEGTGLTFDNTGTVELGAGAQLQGVGNTFTAESAGTLQFDVSGASAFGQILLDANGALNLAGTANPALQGGFVPTSGEKFQVITAPHHTGCFTAVQQGLTADCSNPGFIDLVGATVQPLEVTTTALPGGTIGQPYLGATLAASGGTPPFSWSLANGSSLPAGLSLSASGAISGTPTGTGSSNFTVQVSDTGNPSQSATAQLAIAVTAPPLAITTTTLPGGTVGTTYPPTALAASGGVTPYSWSLAAGSALPAGLALNGATGAISGTPTAAGAITFTIDVRDAEGAQQTASAALSISIAPAQLAVTTTTLPGGTVGVAYPASTLAASGGTTPYSWSLAGGSSLPAGLSLSTAGVISGTPKTSGTVTFTIDVSDAGSPAQSAATTLSLAVVSGLAVSTATLPVGVVNQTYSATTLSATGGTTPYSWALAAGSSLPAGLNLSSAGVISGTPTSAGTTSFTVQVSDGENPAQTASAKLSIAISGALAVTTTTLPGGTINQPYPATTLATANGTAPLVWALAGGTSLPASLSLSAAGVISGTPTSVGSTTFTVQVKDSGSPAQTATAQLTIVVSAVKLAITTTTLPGGTVGQAYPSTTLAVSGGTPPFSWSLANSSALPAGLHLSTTGVISGTPTAAGTAQFSVVVTDAATPAQTATAPLSISVGSGFAITTTSLAQATVGKDYSATLAATGGTQPFQWSLARGSALPPGLRLSLLGVITGQATCQSGNFFFFSAPFSCPTVTTTTFTVNVHDASNPLQTATKQLSITVAPAPLAIANDVQNVPAQVGQPFRNALDPTGTGGTGNYSWALASGSSLPPGLKLTVASFFGTNFADISGTPTTAGTTTFGLTLTDTSKPAQSVTAQITFTVAPDSLHITTASLFDATLSQNYSASLAISGKSTPPYHWSITSGALPPGLTLNATTGQISGKPAKLGAYTFTVQVTDSSKPQKSSSASLTLTVDPTPLSITPPRLPFATAQQTYSATLTAAGGMGPYTFTVISGALPPGLSLSASGAISGTPTQVGLYTFYVEATDSLGAKGVRPYFVIVF